MIAPSCPSLLRRKLELKNIQFIQSEKVLTIVTLDSKSGSLPPAININKADKDILIVAFKGTGVRLTTIDKLINLRQRKSYIHLESLAFDLKFTDAVRKKLQEKLNKAEICF